MHKYLRAWREQRGLTLEEVAATIGRKHSTISRWESGKMSLKTRDLQRLAKLYNATDHQIHEPPDQAALVTRLDQAQQIIEGLDTDTLEHWLAIGRAMAQTRNHRAS